jgi:hypothetical protein
MKICAECRAVFDGRKWNTEHGLTREKIATLEPTLCTACKRIRDNVALGTAYLDGEVIASQPDEVLRMIRREEEIERTRNYSSRILDIERAGSKMTVRTVNTLLAIYIAKQCRKTFKGKIEIFKDTPGHRPRNKETEGTVAVKWTQNP